MTVFLTRSPGVILLQALATGPGGLIGDYVREVRPGGSALGRSYEEWDAVDGDRVEIGDD